MNSCTFFASGTHSMMHLVFPLKKRISFLISSSKAKKWSLLIFEIQFPIFSYLCLRPTRNEKWSLKTKMDNPAFFNEEYIPMVKQDEDY